jgi:carbonic anhydrase
VATLSKLNNTNGNQNTGIFDKMKSSLSVKSSFIFSGLILCLALPLSAAEEDSPHWSYEGESGPEHWGELSPDFLMCSEGWNQSPINLVNDVQADLPKLEFEYYSANVDEINNGHSIQQNIKPGSFLRIPERDTNFQLKQFHFHSPSEHTINGKFFAMEIHFVHTDKDGELMVAGVMVDEGEEHPVLNKLWAFMPENPGETRQEPIGFEETDLLPATREYYAYSGSLTTPPCSEGVKWVVLKTPIQASSKQISTFQNRVGPATNRPVQPIHARTILD